MSARMSDYLYTHPYLLLCRIMFETFAQMSRLIGPETAQMGSANS